jgi:serine phosphatase RsbU (regulator of sigma subunit)
MFSDGYADQFGGPDNKKFMIRRFRDFLTEVHKKPMSQQMEILDQEFEEWKGDQEQVDDVIVMGIRI